MCKCKIRPAPIYIIIDKIVYVIWEHATFNIYVWLDHGHVCSMVYRMPSIR